MRLERFYTILGLFCGGAIILSVFTAIFFYDVYSREKQNSYVMFFNGSLEGLNPSSTITYNGVKVGEVKLIEITEDKAEDKVRVPVYVQFFIEKRHHWKQSPIQLLINQGYVANIKKPNFITGNSSIELVEERKPRKFKIQRYHGYIIFPTKEKIESAVSLDETLKAAKKTFEDISAFIESPKVRDTIEATRTLANSLNQLAISLNQETSPLITTFTQTLLNISGAASSLQSLTDYLSRNPEALLRGKV